MKERDRRRQAENIEIIEKNKTKQRPQWPQYRSSLLPSEVAMTVDELPIKPNQ